MSVINKMLRDLEQQHARQAHSPLVFSQKKSTSWLPWLAVPVALLLGWGAHYLSSEPSQLFGAESLQDSAMKKASSAQPNNTLPQETESLLLSENDTKTATAFEPQAQSITSSALATSLQERLDEELVATQEDAKTIELEHEPEQLVTPSAFALGAVASVKEREVIQALSKEQDVLQETAFESFAAASLHKEQNQALEAQKGLDDFWQEPALTMPLEVKPRSLSIEKVKQSPEEERQAYAQQARKAESLGQLQHAIEAWQQSARLNLNDSEPYLQQARLWQQQGNLNAAETALRQGLSLNQPAIAIALATQLSRQQRWSEALQALNASPELALYPDFYGLKATALQQTQQFSEASMLFLQLARLQPAEARWWLGLALSYDALLEPALALQAYRQAAHHGHLLAQESLAFVRTRLAELE